MAARSTDADVHVRIAIAAAEVQIALGDNAEAVGILKETVAQTRRTGFVNLEFDARLALGRTEIKSGNTAAGIARLEALEKQAKAKGFILVARKAADARK